MIILSDRIYKGLHNGMDHVAYNLLLANAPAKPRKRQYYTPGQKQKLHVTAMAAGLAPLERIF